LINFCTLEGQDETGFIGWGANQHYILGNGNQGPQVAPVPSVAKVADVAVYDFSATTGVAITKSGAFIVWGKTDGRSCLSFSTFLFKKKTI
jgi:hypothetical protein